jgi:hypothetical protein
MMKDLNLGVAFPERTFATVDHIIPTTVDVEHLDLRAEAMVFKCLLEPSAQSALVAGEWDPIAQLLEGEPQARALAKTLPYTSW